MAQTGSGEQDPSSLVLEYVGYWNWDFALFLERAEIRAYEDGRRLRKVEFRAPKSLNLSKFGEGAKRIRIMMDVLFEKISLSEANESVGRDEDLKAKGPKKLR